MKTELIKWLFSCETDVDGALNRFSENEAVYLTYLKSFPQEPTMAALDKAIKENNLEDAFTYCHALKGLAGNLGFIPLYHATAEFVLLLREHKYDNLEASYEEIKRSYKTVVTAITYGFNSIQ